MSHETNSLHDNKPNTPFQSSFWFVIILVGLFIAAVNFVNVMSHDEGHGGSHHTEAPYEGHDAAPAQGNEDKAHEAGH